MKTCDTLQRIIKSKRLPVFLIGSGISMRYISNYPSWIELLKLVAKRINIDDDMFFNLKNITEAELNTNERELVYPDLAFKFASILSNKIQNKELSYANLFSQQEHSRMLKNDLNPIKLLTSSILSNCVPDQNLEELVEFKKLQNVIDTIVTTNYDLFLENIVFEGKYNVYNSQSSLYFNDAQNSGEIFKIHGCIKDPNSLVLNSKDYSDFFEKRKLTTAKLITLLCEHPIITIGYSLNDPNLLNILFDIRSCLDEQNVQKFDKNLIVIDYKKDETDLIETPWTLTRSNNNTLNVIKITTDNYLDIFKNFQQLKPNFKPSEYRKFKKLMKEILIQNQAGIDNILAIDESAFEDKPANSFAVCFGNSKQISQVKNNISTVGLFATSINYFLLEALLDGNSINSEQVLIDDITKKAGYYPMHYFLKKSNKTLADLSENLQSYINKIYEPTQILSKNIIKTLKNVPVFSEISDLIQHIHDEPLIDRKLNAILKNLTLFQNGKDLKLFIRGFYENDNDYINQGKFRKLIVICDAPNYNCISERMRKSTEVT